jgi:hypothetical protein
MRWHLSANSRGHLLFFGAAVGLSGACAGNATPGQPRQSDSMAGSAGSGGSSSTGPAGSAGSAASAGGVAGSAITTAGAAGTADKAPPGIGSKCMTKCPYDLLCEPAEWKGLCTRDCANDADCGGTGVPGVCASGRCYRGCTPVSDDCQRLRFTCVGEPGHTYCTSLTMAGAGGTAGSGSGSGGVAGSAAVGGSGGLSASGNAGGDPALP